MPEGPEASVIARDLEENLGNSPKKIKQVQGYPCFPGLEEQADTVKSARAHGKVVVLKLASGRAWRVGLGMTGTIQLLSVGSEIPKHTKFAAQVTCRDGSERILCFVDPRNFGSWNICESEDEAVKGLGPDWKELTPSEMAQILYTAAQKSRAKKVKTAKELLVDQAVVAGVGNAYSVEAFFHAEIDPRSDMRALSEDDWKAVSASALAEMSHGLDLGGLSLKDFVSPLGILGKKQDHLAVYRREGKGCLRSGCDGTVVREEQAGRATFLCPTCQRRRL